MAIFSDNLLGLKPIYTWIVVSFGEGYTTTIQYDIFPSQLSIFPSQIGIS